MAGRRGPSGARWRWLAGAGFVAGFVLSHEFTQGEAARLAVSAVLSLLALVYGLVLFLPGREGDTPGRTLREFLALGGALTLLVTSSPLAEYLARPLLVRPDVDRADAIVVLGAGLHPNGRLTARSLERALYGVELFRRDLAPALVVSGGITGEASRPEADALAEFARGAGVPAPAIVAERASRTTYENAVETARLLRERGWRRVLLVTSGPHMYRSRLAFERQGVQVLPAPVETREGLRYMAGGRPALFRGVVHEYGGLVVYKVWGRI